MRTYSMDGYASLLWGLERQPRLRSGIVGVFVLDGPLDSERLRNRLAEVAEHVPLLRSTIVRRPHPIATERWREHDTVDIDSLITYVSAEDVPGGLDGLTARLADQAYEADRPLWDLHIVSDIEPGTQHTAVAVRIHHSVTDGLGAIIMAALLFEADVDGTRLMAPEPRVPAQARNPENALPVAPGAVRAAAHAVVDDAAELVRLVAGSSRQAVSAVWRQPRAAARDAAAYGASLARLLAPAPKPMSPLLQGESEEDATGPMVTVLTYALEDFKRFAAARGGRMNDAFLSGVALGLRHYHHESDLVQDAVRISMPVSYRGAGGEADIGPDAAGGNQFSPVRFELPLHAETPDEVFEAVRDRVSEARSEPAIPATDAIAGAMGRLPPIVAELMLSGMFYGVDLATTNVPGPPIQLFLHGRRVEALYAVAPRIGTAANIALVSYNGTVKIALNMNHATTRDPTGLVAALRHGFDVVTGGHLSSGQESVAAAEVNAAG